VVSTLAAAAVVADARWIRAGWGGGGTDGAGSGYPLPFGSKRIMLGGSYFPFGNFRNTLRRPDPVRSAGGNRLGTGQYWPCQVSQCRARHACVTLRFCGRRDRLCDVRILMAGSAGRAGSRPDDRRQSVELDRGRAAFSAGLQVRSIPDVTGVAPADVQRGIGRNDPAGHRSGALEAERLVCIYSSVGGWTYPLFAHWVWSDGWLRQLGSMYGLGQGFVDGGGAGTIQVMGGLSALSMAWILGPRRGKYSSEGGSAAIPAHNVVLVLAGCLLAWVGWLGLNSAGAILFHRSEPAAVVLIAVNTTLSAAASGLAAVIATRIRFGRPDASLAANGWMAGLVASSAAAPF